MKGGVNRIIPNHLCLVKRNLFGKTPIYTFYLLASVSDMNDTDTPN